nr:retrovirus-related Pol polyprotein from transposon TNT 1-94 [Tanacetum cinerariifolium]
LESVEARLFVYQQNESVFVEDIKLLKLEVQLRDNALVVLRQNFKKAEQERDDLKLKLEKLQTSSKNLSELLSSQTNDKTGLGYNSQVFTRAMFDCDDYLTSGSDESLPPSPIYDRYQSRYGYLDVPPPYTGTFMPPKPDLVFNNAPNDVETFHTAFNVKLSPTKLEIALSHHRPSAPIIEDLVSDSEDESETNTPENVPSFVQPTEQIKSLRPSVQHVKTFVPPVNSKTAIPKPTSNGKRRNRKTCLCRSLDHLIKDCDYHEKKMAQPTARNHAKGGNYKQYASMTFPNPHRHVVPTVVLAQSKLVPINDVRPVTTVVPKTSVTRPRQAKTVVTKPNSPYRRHINRYSGKMGMETKMSNLRPCFPQYKCINDPQKDKGVIDSGCSRHMTGNMSYLSDFEELNGGYVAFGRNPKGGKISRKGKIRTGKLDFDDVYFVKELKFNLFSVSQISVNQPLHMLHMDLFGPTFVKSPNKKSYFLVVIDDYSRFTWVFFLATKDETSPILKTFITGLENQLSLKVKIIRSDNETEFKNNDLNQFCGMERIKREFSVPRTPQQNGIAERKNKTLIEAARTMLADSLLSILFWAEAVNTACYVQNRNTDGDATFDEKEPEFERRKHESEVNVSPSSSALSKKHDDKTKREAKGKSPVESLTGYRNLSAEFEDLSDNSIYEDNAADTSQYPDDTNMPELEDITYSDYKDDAGAEADFNNLETTITVSPIPTTRVHKDLPVTQIIGDLSLATQTRSMTREELLQFKMQKVWVLVDLPHGKRTIGHTQEEGIDYKEVFALVARIEAIKLFLAYASFMGFMVYRMDVKSAFLYGTIEEEVYVCHPLGFEDPDYPDKVYKVVKALYGLHQAPRAWKFGLTDAKSASTPIDTEKPLLKDPDGENVDVHTYRSMIGSLMYLTSPRPDIMFAVVLSGMESLKRMVHVTNILSAGYLTTPQMVLNSRCLTHIKNWLVQIKRSLVNDVTRFQALVDKKKVIITEATIRDALRLDDAEGIECLPNEEIFIELARMGYEKPSTKLTFYKAFFLSQWKFLIHTILQCMSAKRMSLERNVDSLTKFYMYPRFLQLMIRAQVGDLFSHTTKYSSPALTQKVFANMKRVGKGCSGVETPLFKGMIVEQQVGEDVDDVHVDDVSTVGVAAEGVVSATDNVVPAAIDEPSIPSLTPPTEPQPPSQDIPSTSQVQLTPPQSPQAQLPSPPHQPQPSQDAGISIDLLQNLLDTCTTLTRRVEHLEQDKVAQALDITKLKQRVKKLKRKNKASKLKRLKKVGSAQRIETSNDTVTDDVSKQGRMIADMDTDVDVILEDAKEVVVEKSADVLSMQDDKVEPAELQEVVKVVTTAKLITEVVTVARTTITTVAPQLTTVAAPTFTTTPRAARRRKGVEPKPLKKQAQIERDEAYARELEAELNKNIDWDEVIDHVQRKQKEDNVVKRYQALKRRQKKVQAMKNMMIYLRNVVGFKMDYFKGMTYDDIRLIFKKKFNSNVAFLLKTKEQMDEEDSRALKRLSESQDDKTANSKSWMKSYTLALKVPVVDYEIYTEKNKSYYKIKRADGSPQLYLSLLSMLRNFDREDLEVLWRLVKERFASTKPKNFSNDFLLTTLGAMFEKLDIQAQIWKNQRIVHGQAKVKS